KRHQAMCLLDARPKRLLMVHIDARYQPLAQAMTDTLPVLRVSGKIPCQDSLPVKEPPEQADRPGTGVREVLRRGELREDAARRGGQQIAEDGVVLGQHHVKLLTPLRGRRHSLGDHSGFISSTRTTLSRTSMTTWPVRPSRAAHASIAATSFSRISISSSSTE